MKKINLIVFFFCAFFGFAQKNVTGTVTDSSGGGLAGVNVVVTPGGNSTSTDFDGKYVLTLSEGTYKIKFSSIDYAPTSEVIVVGKDKVVKNVSLLNDTKSLDEIVVVGSRIAPRSNTSSALPIDVLSSKDLASTGQNTFDKALQYKIPSFNTVQTPVNDATSLLDPYEIRNMGPSRTLILVNGKRKNLSSLVYVQTSPGRGETGADISAIPTDAIDRVEILRDGASAQYGSDAIAGVMNIILKKSTNGGSATMRTGVTSKGDGEMYGISLNNGTKVGEKGFVNYTVDFSTVNQANRPGAVSAIGEYNDFVFTSPTKYSNYVNYDSASNHYLLNGNDVTAIENSTVLTAIQKESQLNNLFTTFKGTAEYTTKFNTINAGNTAGKASIDKFLKEKPDAGNINGSPKTTAAKFEINGGNEINDHLQFYYNAAYVYKKVNSYANYRTPYWRALQNFNYNATVSAAYPNWEVGQSSDRSYLASLFGNGTAASYNGYVPTFIGDLKDYNATLGFKSKMNDWVTDASITFGGNEQVYTVGNSQNRSGLQDANGQNIYRENSQITFKPGGTDFNHIVGNIDVSKALSDNVGIAFGAEFRSENFEVIAGEKASYDGIGADSFAGNRPENSGKWNRYNLGVYADLSANITKEWLANATLRHENYSDFGPATVWKLSTSYKASDKYTLRTSLSTGFRAPTLHQIYTQKSQYSFVPGQGIQVSGIINNVSQQARQLGIPQLTPEKSTNFTVGIGGKPTKNLNFTLDYYLIKLKDRIVLGDKVATPFGTVAWFSNSFNSSTAGLDLVVNYSNIVIGEGKLGLILSANKTLQNERTSAVTNNSFGATLDALTFTSRPESKYILGANYKVGKFDFSLNNTRFGKTTFKQDGLDSNLRTEFTPKVVTDLGINYAATDKLTFALNINNILNIIPKWEFVAENAAGQAILNDPSKVQEQSNLITFNQRYDITTYDGSHFSQLGTMFNLSMNYRF